MMWLWLALASARPGPWADPFEVVDALAWAADDREVRRWLREAHAADGRWARSVRPSFRGGRAQHRPLVAVEAEVLEQRGAVAEHRPREAGLGQEQGKRRGFRHGPGS